MLKHVSHRASSTSLCRPVTAASKSSTMAGSGTGRLAQSIIAAGVVSAPNSPHPSHTRYHTLAHLQKRVVDLQLEKSQPGSASKERPAFRVLPESIEKSSGIIDTPNEKSSPCGEAGNFESLKGDDNLSKEVKDLNCASSLIISGEMISADEERSADNISLHSSTSLASFARSDFMNSSTSLIASKVPLRIHLRQLLPDIEYKTLRLDEQTSCRQLIEHLLQKLRLKHRDPNLFAVVLEVAVKGVAGAPPRKQRLILDDSARPVELQQCRPRGEANFSITMRRGGVLRVRDSVLVPGSQYKAFLVSFTSTVVDVIKLLLKCNNCNPLEWRQFTLHEVCSEPFHDRLLSDDEYPLRVQCSWVKDNKQNYMFILRRLITKAIVEGKKNLDEFNNQESFVDVEVDTDEQNNTACNSMLMSSSGSSRSRSSISSSTASVHSLASLSSNGSSRCSFSSNSSSGISSGSSLCSTNDTPQKNSDVIKRYFPHTLNVSHPKLYPISVEENIQSYFSMQPEEDSFENASVATEHEETDSAVDSSLSTSNSSVMGSKCDFSSNEAGESDKLINSGNGENKISDKSWQTPFSTPSLWTKVRESTVLSLKSDSKLTKAAITSTPSERPKSHYNSCECSNLSSTHNSQTKLTFKDSSGFIRGRNLFSFRKPRLCKSHSTSSLKSVCSQSADTEPLTITPLSNKLLPLSVAPNSSMTFPSCSSTLTPNQTPSTVGTNVTETVDKFTNCRKNEDVYEAVCQRNGYLSQNTKCNEFIPQTSASDISRSHRMTQNCKRNGIVFKKVDSCMLPNVKKEFHSVLADNRYRRACCVYDDCFYI